MKFYESGMHSQIMPSGHMAHALPRENFQAKAPVQVHAALPPQPNMERQQAIISALRSGTNGPPHSQIQGSNPNQGIRGSGKIISNPGYLPRSRGTRNGP